MRELRNDFFGMFGICPDLSLVWQKAEREVEGVLKQGLEFWFNGKGSTCIRSANLALFLKFSDGTSVEFIYDNGSHIKFFLPFKADVFVEEITLRFPK